MKTRSFSIVVGGSACNANCPFCISKMTASPLPIHEIDTGRFLKACKIVEQAADGLITVTLTSKGETTLYRKQIDEYLKHLPLAFPIVDLQTNGTFLEGITQTGELYRWKNMGLTTVSVSIAHYDPILSNELMGINWDFDFWDTIKLIHGCGMMARLNCTLLKNGVNDWASARMLIQMAGDEGVEQLTLREVEMPTSTHNEAVTEYVRNNKPWGLSTELQVELEGNGATQLLHFPHGAVVYDYQGQNVCVTNCLTPPEGPGDLRHIIFYPDGRIMYDWAHEGARIL